MSDKLKNLDGADEVDPDTLEDLGRDLSGLGGVLLSLAADAEHSTIPPVVLEFLSRTAYRLAGDVAAIKDAADAARKIKRPEAA